MEQDLQEEKKSIFQKGKCFVAASTDVCISIYLFLIIAVMPLYFTNGFKNIGTDKAMFFRKISIYGGSIILSLVVLYLLMLIVEKGRFADKWNTFKKSVTLTDVFAFFYGISVIISYFCSNYKESILWGAKGWFMGLLPQLFLIMIYFLTSRFWKPKKWILLLSLPVSAIVFLLGYLNRFGIYPIDMKIRNANFISTVGNINWYCGYQVSVFFAGVYLLWQTKKKTGDAEEVSKKAKIVEKCKQIGLLIYVAIGYASLVTQGSVSGIFALAVVTFVMFCLSAKDKQSMRMFWIELLILAGACQITMLIRVLLRLILWQDVTLADGMMDLLTYSNFPPILAAIALFALYRVSKREFNSEKMVVMAKRLTLGMAAVAILLVLMITVNTLHPGSLGPLSDVSVFTFNEKWGSYRGATWMAGWKTFTEQNWFHKLVGIGPDAMTAFLYSDASVELQKLLESAFGTQELSNAHNEWLTVLVNMGLLGLVSFAGMIISAIHNLLKSGLKKANLIAGACGLCVLAYTVNNVFSFQQTLNTATIFVILGIGSAYARKD